MTGKTIRDYLTPEQIEKNSGWLNLAPPIQKGEVRNPNGRPIEYTPEIVNGYLDQYLTWLTIDDNLFMTDFAKEFGIDNELFADRIDKPDFPFIARKLKIAHKIREEKIVKLAMQGKHRDAMSIFYLKNRFGYADKIEQSNTSNIPIQLNINLPQQGQAPNPEHLIEPTQFKIIPNPPLPELPQSNDQEQQEEGDQ